MSSKPIITVDVKALNQAVSQALEIVQAGLVKLAAPERSEALKEALRRAEIEHRWATDPMGLMQYFPEWRELRSQFADALRSLADQIEP